MSREAYETALDRLEDIEPEDEDRNSVLTGLFIEELQKNSGYDIESANDEPGDAIEKLAEELGIAQNEVQRLVELSKDNIYLLQTPNSGSNKERTQKTALMYLGIKRILSGREFVPAQEMKEFLRDYGAYDSNSSTHLGEFEPYIIKEKDGGKQNTKYRATHPGIEKLKEIAQELLEGSQDD